MCDVAFKIDITGSNHAYCVSALRAVMFKHVHCGGDGVIVPVPLPER
jgi:hypothetical protein